MPTLQLDDTHLHYDDDGDGPPVVLLHGFGQSARAWNAQRADLAEDHRVVAYDLRGCGRSGHRANGNSIARNVADLEALCAALDLDRPLLAASSMGSVFALEAARAGLASGVVTVGCPAHWGVTDNAPDLGAWVRDLADQRAATVAAMVPGWYAPGTDAALPAWTVRQIMDSGPFIDHLFAEMTTYDPRPWLSEATVPVRVVHGVHDAIPLAVSEELAAGLPNAELILAEASGHMAHQEEPALVTGAIRALTMAHTA